MFHTNKETVKIPPEYWATTTKLGFIVSQELLYYRSFYPDHHRNYQRTTRPDTRELSHRINGRRFSVPCKDLWIWHQTCWKALNLTTERIMIYFLAWLAEISQSGTKYTLMDNYLLAKRKLVPLSWNPTIFWETKPLRFSVFIQRDEVV